MNCIKLKKNFTESISCSPKIMAAWLSELTPTKRGKEPFRISTVELKISFVRHEDAVAFRLKFGA